MARSNNFAPDCSAQAFTTVLDLEATITSVVSCVVPEFGLASCGTNIAATALGAMTGLTVGTAGSVLATVAGCIENAPVLSCLSAVAGVCQTLDAAAQLDCCRGESNSVSSWIQSAASLCSLQLDPGQCSCSPGSHHEMRRDDVNGGSFDRCAVGTYKFETYDYTRGAGSYYCPGSCSDPQFSVSTGYKTTDLGGDWDSDPIVSYGQHKYTTHNASGAICTPEYSPPADTVAFVSGIRGGRAVAFPWTRDLYQLDEEATYSGNNGYGAYRTERARACSGWSDILADGSPDPESAFDHCQSGHTTVPFSVYWPHGPEGLCEHVGWDQPLPQPH